MRSRAQTVISVTITAALALALARAAQPGALDVVFVADEGVLLVLCSDLMFSFFRTLSKQTVNSETVKPTGRAPMNVQPSADQAAAIVQQYKAVWCPGTNLVYTVGLENAITLWRVGALDKDGRHSIIALKALERHTDVVKDLCVIESPKTLTAESQFLASASLDASIQVGERGPRARAPFSARLSFSRTRRAHI